MQMYFFTFKEHYEKELHTIENDCYDLYWKIRFFFYSMLNEKKAGKSRLSLL